MGLSRFMVSAAMAAGMQSPPAAAGSPSEAAEPDPSVIIVTGERVRRTVAETASSVVVFDESDIEAS